MKNSGIPLSVVIVAVAVFAVSCGKRQAHAPEASKTDQFGPYISAFTSGVISRESNIRIELVSEVEGEKAQNKPAKEGIFSFTPPIKGSAVWTDNRTIEFRPGRRLKDGQKYNAVFRLGEVLKVPPEVREFRFVFTAIKQTFDVSLEGLQPLNADELKWQQLSGSLTLADNEDGQAVEAVVSAQQDGKKLPVRWYHGSDRHRHRFVIDSVERKDDSSLVMVSWNGEPIGADVRGSRNVRVPAIGDFSVISVSVVNTDDMHILIRFSDPVMRKQNLNGLIQIGNESQFRYSVERNEIRVYPSRRISGIVDVRVYDGVRNIAGKALKQEVSERVVVESLKPQVRFAGKGVILPSGKELSIPFEAVNLNAVDVRVVRVFETNVPQFLQVNDLSGTSEMRRVGRTIWKKRVPLNITPDMQDRWVRCAFDVTQIVSEQPGALYYISLSFRKAYSLYPCAGTAAEPEHGSGQPVSENEDDDEEENESSYWDGSEEYWEDGWENRDNPCHEAYYSLRYNAGKRFANRNFLVSDIGIIAKRGVPDTLYLALTDIRTARPMSGARISVCNYQHQEIGAGESGGEGLAAVAVSGKPFLVIASNGKQKGYLKVDEGSTQPVSHFDVGGQALQAGLKGMLYGERGVWRPGDSLYLTFVLDDRNNPLPSGYPVSMDLINPRGQVVRSLRRTPAAGRFYNFSTSTTPDAVTGNYTARVKAGGAVFEQTLKIETVMPNRLKVQLAFADTVISAGVQEGTITARWLTGAAARNLKADVEMSLEPTTTIFGRYGDYVFDDPVRSFSPQTEMVFEGVLNNEGTARFRTTVSPGGSAPGRLCANFRTRVFEPSGAFSVDHMSLECNPYDRYVGIALPKGDRSRGMLLTDTTHTARIVTVDRSGRPVSANRIKVDLYKIEWRWWWEKGEERLADWIARENTVPILSDTVTTRNGEGVFFFRVKYPEWGRFLVRAVDMEGGHATGKVIYIDWPGWAGKGQKEMPGGATVLTFASDREEYNAGEKASVSIPSSEGGRIFVSLENGSKVLRQFWIASAKKETVFSFDVTEEMAPGIYVYATYLQPYEQTVNDLPLRMYGVIPLRVVFPATKLSPQIDAPEVLQPEKKAIITVSEKTGRAMTYTLALVDEGLLDLTRFKTPDLWNHFYRREALGVHTWDLYDMVCGAYGAKLERLIAIGGDEGIMETSEKRGNRFPPMVRFAGPFYFDKGKKGQHEIDIPQYVGSVRIMVVAGQDGAYGSAEKTVPVRKPLMVLGTLPRVLSPQERVKLPVSVFALDSTVKKVKVSVAAEGGITVSDQAEQTLNFTGTGDELVTFLLTCGNQTGWAKVVIKARGAGHSAEQTIDIEIRNPAVPVTDCFGQVLQPGEEWKKEFSMPGIAGTNSGILELSRIPPVDLGKRLDYLICYPHGCVEQTTSSVFPQLYLDKLVDLPADRKKEIQNNVNAGIERLRTFQTSSGGFSYWPGGGEPDPWASSYAAHFLLEARLCGYGVSQSMLDHWQRFQRSAALSWSEGDVYNQFIQAYRLFTLALSGALEIGAMNRLRETPRLATAPHWLLAAAYQHAGQTEYALELAAKAPIKVAAYSELGGTYGSDIRDMAIILETLSLLRRTSDAAMVAKELCEEMTKNKWMSTQTTAYSLCALAKFLGGNSTSGRIDGLLTFGGKETKLSSPSVIMQHQLPIPADAQKGELQLVNKGSGIMYARLMLKGMPAPGMETESSTGLVLSVEYQDREEDSIDPTSLVQGTDFTAVVTVKTAPGRGPYQNIALTNIFPSGWEIRNMRMEGIDRKPAGFDYQDIRDDRVYTYFSLQKDESKQFKVQLNAAYLGSFYLPQTYVEAMYDASINARIKGKWVEVKEPGRE